ncbi:hypothetical protein Aperf_G00000026137 [Anoplocephala perfoliata]
MEISREYQPIFKTTISGLAKMKLQGQGDLSRQEVSQIIALCALQENKTFPDYKMDVYVDVVRFEKNQDGSTFPEIPYASIVRLVVLPNFPDVCFIQFRRNAYKMYIVFRVRKTDYLSKLVRVISTWNEANFSESEDTETPPAQSHPTQQIHGSKPVKNVKQLPQYLPISFSHKRRLQSEVKAPTSRSKNYSKLQIHNKVRPVDAVKDDGPCELVCIKHDHKEPLKHRNHSQPNQERDGHRPRKRSHSEPHFHLDSDVEIIDDSRPRFRTRPGEYSIIFPTQMYPHTSKGRHKRADEPQERVILAQKSESNSLTSSSSNLSELLERGSVEITTIYPSSIDFRRLSPRSLRNERLLHELHKSQHPHESHGHH